MEMIEMEKYINEFLGEPDAPFATNTRLTYGAAIKQYLEWTKSNGLDSLSPESVKRLFDHLLTLGVKPSTLSLKRAALRSFFLFCIDEGYVSSNPAQNIKLKSVPLIKKTIITDLEVIYMCEACKGNLRDRTIIQLMFDTGLRISEICSLNTINVIFDTSKLYIAPGKNRTAREMPLTFESASLIKKYLDTRTDSNPALFITRLGKRFTRQGLHKLFKSYLAKSQIDTIYTSHSCRWRFGTMLANKEFKIEEINILMGHTVLQSTERYINMSDEEYARLQNKYNQD